MWIKNGSKLVGGGVSEGHSFNVVKPITLIAIFSLPLLMNFEVMYSKSFAFGNVTKESSSTPFPFTFLNAARHCSLVELQEQRQPPLSQKQRRLTCGTHCSRHRGMRDKSFALQIVTNSVCPGIYKNRQVASIAA